MKKSIFLFFAAILCATSAWAAKERVYFVNTPGWSTIKVHAWGGSATGTSWPGATATKDSWQWNGKDVYYLEAEEGAYKNCIFNNGSGTQTADLAWKANYVYWFANTDDKNSGDNKWIPVEVAQANTTGTKIYFVNKQGWSTVKVYAWGVNVNANAGWSGVNMTKETFQLNGYDVYSYIADKEYDFCIFNDGSSQTSDLYWYQGIDKYYYDDEWQTQAQIGTPKTYKNIKITATVKCETAPTIWWWGAGDKLADAEETSGVAWPGVAMTKEGDKYVYTFSDVDDSKGVNYLIVSDGIQGYNQHATDDTSVDFINMLPIVAAEGIGGNWGGENKLTPETQDNGYIAKWTTNLTQGDHDIKVTIDKDGAGDRAWYGSNVITISRAENAKVFNDDANKGSENGKLVADIAGDYTFTYTYKTQTLTVTYPELPTPEYKDITVTVYAKEVPNIWWWNGGDKCDDADDAYDWVSAPAMETVVIDGNTWYQKTFKDVDVALGGIKFKLKSQDQSKESNELQTTEDKCYDARVITGVTETPCGVLPEGEIAKLTYYVEVPEGTNDCYIAGEMNGWTLTQMNKVDDRHYTITIEGATTAHTYKYASGPDSDWKYVEVKEDGSNVSNRTYNANDVVEKWKAVYDPSAPVKAVKIAGSMTEWEKSPVAFTIDGTIATLSIELTQGYHQFKIIETVTVDATDKDNWYGNGGTMTRKNCTNWTFDSDKNATVFADAPGTYTFKWDITTDKLSITNMPAFPDLSHQPATLYFKPSTNWKENNAKYAAYFCYGDIGTDDKWVEMTPENGIYKVSNSDKKYVIVIFVRLNPDGEISWESQWNQTDNLIIPNTPNNLNTCFAFWKNSWDDVSGLWVAPTPLTDANWSAFITAYKGKTINALVERSFNYNQLHTLCLPFNLSTNWLGDEAKAYQLTSVVSNSATELELKATECATITAGKPYIVSPTKGSEYEHLIVADVAVQNVSAGSYTITGGGYKVTMQGIDATPNPAQQTDGSTEYWLAMEDGCLYKTPTNKLGLRSIIKMTTTSGAPINVRARVAFNENVETGVEDIITTDAPVKVIENGQLIIIRDGVKYNVQGQKL